MRLGAARRSDTRDHTNCCRANAAQPATAMPEMFIRSCSALRQISLVAPKAIASAILPAAGTVVTEMKTPVRPPALAEVSDKAPAAPAMTATMNDHLSGW